MAFATCPKCGHAPLPRDQALPAACPACGLVLAKFGAPAPPRPIASQKEDEAGEGETLASRLLELPAALSRPAWQARAVGLALFAAWTLWILLGVDIRGGDAGSWLLHSVLLPFHEAGHYLLFRWFGPFIMTLGGTLGQHLLPIVMGWALLFRHRDPFGAAFCLWLLGFSTIDMAVYMYDAFDPKLMLLGGATGAESDGHDWQNLFGDMGLLRRARGIGLFFGVLGMATMVAALAWAARWLNLARDRVDASLEGVNLP
jgi:hypothetical protein